VTGQSANAEHDVPAAIVLWDDTPSAVDLLGFDAVVAPVLAAVEAPDLDPLTLGIHGPWGGGKSTILGLLEAELRDEAHVVVATTPWEYDDHTDVKGTLIAQVLGELEARFGENGSIKDKISDLLKRISWSRATRALAKGALTMHLRTRPWHSPPPRPCGQCQVPTLAGPGGAVGIDSVLSLFFGTPAGSAASCRTLRLEFLGPPLLPRGPCI
jgi:hypothetical protein